MDSILDRTRLSQMGGVVPINHCGHNVYKRGFRNRTIWTLRAQWVGTTCSKKTRVDLDGISCRRCVFSFVFDRRKTLRSHPVGIYRNLANPLHSSSIYIPISNAIFLS